MFTSGRILTCQNLFQHTSKELEDNLNILKEIGEDRSLNKVKIEMLQKQPQQRADVPIGSPGILKHRLAQNELKLQSLHPNIDAFDPSVKNDTEPLDTLRF